MKNFLSVPKDSFKTLQQKHRHWNQKTELITHHWKPVSRLKASSMKKGINGQKMSIALSFNFKKI